MPSPIRVLMVTPEAVPFAKTGGLADVAGALPVALASLGCEVRAVMPRYRQIDARAFGLEQIMPREVQQFGNAEIERDIWHRKTSDGVDWYFVNAPAYYHREYFYSVGNTDYEDNAERFAFFAQQALQLIKRLRWKPDVIHCHDWQTALVPAYLRNAVKTPMIDTRHPFYAGVKTLLTIHNLAYHGQFPKEKLTATGLGRDLYDDGDLEFWGKINYLKAGLLYANQLNTVSRTYAKEIQTEKFGCGLDGVLRKRAKDLVGILNGIDTTVWNPQTDDAIPANYHVDDLRGKVQCKRALLRAQGLELRAETPLIGIVGRLVAQKGFDLIERAFDDIMALGVQIVVLGTGDPAYHTMLERMRDRYPDRVALNLTFNNSLAHLIEAGADMFLMPSRFEPCGLNQMYSLAYGTVPIVHATGGLADTVRDIDSSAGNGNGFVFTRYEPAALVNAVRRAVAVYPDRNRWLELMRTGMREDYSWRHSAEQYRDVYEEMVTVW